jgi:hypothetical protein
MQLSTQYYEIQPTYLNIINMIASKDYSASPLA